MTNDTVPTAYITHPSCLLHQNFPGHPEDAARLAALEDHLHGARLYDYLTHLEAPPATRAQLLRVHTEAYIAAIQASAPTSGSVMIDADTCMNPHSLDAALHAAGAVVLGVDQVCTGKAKVAFCAVRPPGHHAGRARSAGFCLFNNIAVGAAHAMAAYALDRVAIVDFDVHHGDGTEDIFADNPRVLFCSTFLHPFYPYCGADTVSDHIINVPLERGTSGARYRELFSARILPALEAFKPQLILISAGFDSHREDDMGGLGLVETDYVWVTERLQDIAKRYSGDRIVSVLEGGYHLSALGRSAAAHIKALARL